MARFLTRINDSDSMRRMPAESESARPGRRPTNARAPHPGRPAGRAGPTRIDGRVRAGSSLDEVVEVGVGVALGVVEVLAVLALRALPRPLSG